LLQCHVGRSLNTLAAASILATISGQLFHNPSPLDLDRTSGRHTSDQARSSHLHPVVVNSYLFRGRPHCFFLQLCNQHRPWVCAGFGQSLRSFEHDGSVGHRGRASGRVATSAVPILADHFLHLPGKLLDPGPKLAFGIADRLGVRTGSGMRQRVAAQNVHPCPVAGMNSLPKRVASKNRIGHTRTIASSDHHGPAAPNHIGSSGALEAAYTEHDSFSFSATFAGDQATRTAAGTKVTNSAIAAVSAIPTVRASDWNIFPFHT